MGPRYCAPEAAPGELFAGDTATQKSEQLLCDLRGFVRRWRHSDPDVSRLRSKRAPPPRVRVEKLQIFSVAQTCAALRRQRAIAVPSGYKRLVLETTALCSPNPYIGWRRCRTERSPTLPGVRLVGVRCHDLRHSAGRPSCSAPSPADPGVSLSPYFAIVARMTAKLMMNPVKAMNLDTSERSGHMVLPPRFSKQILSVD